jgi:phosphoglycerol transferase MdoB-like AlkP superfamily enzyme
MKQKIPLSLRYLFTVYIAGLVLFMGFRLLMLAQHWSEMKDLPQAAQTTFYALFMGFRFDTVISGYLLAAPLLIGLVAEFTGFLTRGVLLFLHWLLSVLYCLCFFGCAADIPFYNNYNTRLNASILAWTDSPAFMVKMVLQDKVFLMYLLVFVVVSMLFVKWLLRIYRRYAAQLPALRTAPRYYVAKAIFSVLAIGLLILGIRGRTNEKTPIQVGTAFFSPYNLPNQLGLNPLFTFLRSYLDEQKEENKYLQIMDEQQALQLVQHYLQVTDSNAVAGLPIARRVSNVAQPEQYNVVLVLMESMSASFMERYGDKLQTTPYLNTLSNQSLCFDRFYSAGIHTHNGIFSTLYSFPALLNKHAMYGDVIPAYTGLPYVLKQNGYHNMFFLTHDDQFDNIGAFTTVNHYDEVIGEKDFPHGEITSTLGVPDHKLFDHAIEHLAKLPPGKPFFATIMTGSNHNPFMVPDDIPFKPRNRELRDGCVEYADWAVERFMKAAAQQPWYRHTVFIFLGDHGAAQKGDMYGDLSYSLNHIPCMIFQPAKPEVHGFLPQVGGQIDVFPTVCGLLGLSYVNNTLGADLLREGRSYTFFSADDKIAVADSSDLYIWHRDGAEHMFSFGKGYTDDVLQAKRTKADSMGLYGRSMVQTTQWLIRQQKTGAH